MQVNCKILSLNGSQKGVMFIARPDFDFADLIKWVHTNCPANNKVIIEKNQVSAEYDDRVEIYWLSENKNKTNYLTV